MSGIYSAYEFDGTERKSVNTENADRYLTNPDDDPDYQKFVMEMARLCRCTPMSDRPCAGLLAGGHCDDLHLDREQEQDDE